MSPNVLIPQIPQHKITSIVFISLIRESMEYARSPRQDDDWFADYHTYEETTAWVNQLVIY